MLIFDEAQALGCDTFAGDETDVTPLSDKFVNAGKPHVCQHCEGPIAKGERIRARKERDNEERRIVTHYFCNACCAAMASDDPIEALEARLPPFVPID